MANPSYPMQPQMQGMQPMQQPQQGPPPAAQRPARGGTSRAVPVVVSAGLAVGVFCGLLFGLGTGEEDLAAASTSASTTPDKPADDEVKPIPSSLGTSPTPPSPPVAMKPVVMMRYCCASSTTRPLIFTTPSETATPRR